MVHVAVSILDDFAWDHGTKIFLSMLHLLIRHTCLSPPNIRVINEAVSEEQQMRILIQCPILRILVFMGAPLAHLCRQLAESHGIAEPLFPL